MTIPLSWIILAFLALTGGIGFGVDGRKIRYPITNRSYQVPLYGTQGIQYYSPGPLYTAIPTVLFPGQVSIPTTPIANVVLPQQADYKPVQEIPGTSSFVPANSKPSLYKIKYRSIGHVHKRPTSYLNHIYPAPVKSYSVVQGQKATTVKSGLDGDNQYQQSAPSTVYQPALGPSAVVPTYGTPKAVEYPKKVIRVPSGSAQTYYRRVTGPLHRHLVYPPKKVYLTGTTAKGHFHYYPTKHFSYSKPIPVIKYEPSGAPVSTESSLVITPRPVQETSSTYTYNIGSEVRFPVDQENAQPSATDSQQTAPGEITRAIIRNQEVNNYDATLPLKIPAKKPYQFEVANLIKNPGLQFLQENQRPEDLAEGQGNALLQTSYTNGHSYAVVPVAAGSSVVTSPSPFDIYNMGTYQSNQLTSDQNLAASKTIKIPVAVIRGVHDLSGISGYSTIRQDADEAEDVKKGFSPSKRTSDWIPMSSGISVGNGTPETVKTSAKKSNHRVEEIISGKIPREFSPDLSSLRYGTTHNQDGSDGNDDEGDVITGKISYQDGHRQRKGVSYVSTIPSTSSDGTSNHVVSSVPIRFGILTLMENIVVESSRKNATNASALHPFPFGAHDKNDFSDSTDKFHLAMLCISFIVGIIYCSYSGYIYWYKGRSFLSYVFALALSLLLRTFFSLLYWAIFMMGGSTDYAGSNTLLAFECFFWNNAVSYWLILTIYLHESVESSFNSEPSIKLFQYLVPGVASFFTLIWTFILSGDHSDWTFALGLTPAYMWIVCILRLLYLCVQLGLTVNMGGMIMTRKSSLDNDCISLLRKASLVFLGLLAIFWMEFGFTVSQPPLTDLETYLYFCYIAIGLQCALACPLLFFLEKWGQKISDKYPRGSGRRVVAVSGQQMPPTNTQEILIKNPYRQTISTIESVYGKRDEDALPETETQDIVYTNIVPPERLQKTFHLYKRFGIFPAGDAATDVSEEKFYECREDDAKTVYKDCISKASDNFESEEGTQKRYHEELNVSDAIQNKNAFYSSKYLLADRAEENFPENQHDRSIQPISDDKKTQNQKTDEMVEKWLKDNSEITD